VLSGVQKTGLCGGPESEKLDSVVQKIDLKSGKSASGRAQVRKIEVSALGQIRKIGLSGRDDAQIANRPRLFFDTPAHLASPKP
jgi:hypothetical protein